MVCNNYNIATWDWWWYEVQGWVINSEGLYILFVTVKFEMALRFTDTSGLLAHFSDIMDNSLDFESGNKYNFFFVFWIE